MLEFMNTQFGVLELPYEFYEWTDPEIPDVFFTGELSSAMAGSEDRENNGIFMLVGHSRSGYAPLEEWRQRLYEHFKDGLQTVGLAAFYNEAKYVPSELEGFQRIEIYFDMKEWR